MLTKKEALEGCRDHWIWMANNPKKFKHEYFEENNIEEPDDSSCYACAYMEQESQNNLSLCREDCILSWTNAGCMEVGSEFVEWIDNPTPENAMAIAKLAIKALAELEE